MSDKIEAKVTHAFAASPERVYDAMLDADKARLWGEAWLLAGSPGAEVVDIAIDPQVNGKFTYIDRRDGSENRTWGRFLALDRPKKLVYTWIAEPEEEDDPSVVTIIIEPEPGGDGAVATLYNEMGVEWADYLPRTEKAWRLMLEAVDGVLQAEGPS